MQTKKYLHFFPAFIFIILLVVLATDTFAQSDQTSGGYVKGMTPGRLKSLVGVALGLAGVIIGWKARSGNRSSVFLGFTLAAAAIILSVIHLLNLSGGFGTGGGKAGALVALLLGIVGCAFSIKGYRVRSLR